MVPNASVCASEAPVNSSEPLLQALIDGLGAHLCVLDEKGVIVAVNAAWRQFAAANGGTPTGCNVGANYLTVCGSGAGDAGSDANRFAAGLRGVLERRYPSFDLPYACHSPTEQRWFTARATRLLDAEPMRVLVEHENVTTLRRATDALERVDRSDRAQSQFIANVSHELRTPLQSVIGYSSMGRQLIQGQPLVARMFEDIHAGGRTMLTLINDLLYLSKADCTDGALSISRCDLCGLIADVAHELRVLGAQRNVRIDLPDPLPAMPVEVDAFRIQQVLRNLLANAMRFAPEHSVIQVECHSLDAQGIEISVRDHGPGIPEAELQTIFDPFVQSSRTVDGAGGTGLGLTICRSILRAHGGSIVAANADGGGALMRITLPAHAPDTTQRPDNLRRTTVLDIDTACPTPSAPF